MSLTDTAHDPRTGGPTATATGTSTTAPRTGAPSATTTGTGGTSTTAPRTNHPSATPTGTGGTSAAATGTNHPSATATGTGHPPAPPHDHRANTPTASNTSSPDPAPTNTGGPAPTATDTDGPTTPATTPAATPTTAAAPAAPATTTPATTPDPAAPDDPRLTGDPRLTWSSNTTEARPAPTLRHRRDGILPAVAAALSVRGADTLTCTAGKADQPPTLHPLVQDFLDTLTTVQRTRFTGRCPEAILLSRHLTAAETGRSKRASRKPLTANEARRSLKHSKLTARRIREDGDPLHGSYAPPCHSCAPLLAHFGVRPVDPTAEKG